MPEFQAFHDSADQTPPPVLLEHGVDRRWDQRGLLLGVVLLTVLAVSPEPQPPGPGAPPQPDPVVVVTATVNLPVSVRVPPVALDLPGDVAGVDIGPQGFTAVVAYGCRNSAPTCVASLAVTEDQKTWVRRPLPKQISTLGLPKPVVLAPGVLLLETHRDRTHRWHSADGGVTWKPVPSERAPAVPDAAAGRLSLQRWGFNTTDQVCHTRRHLSVIRRDTGRTARLASQPPLAACDVTPFPDAAGRLWLTGLDPVSGRAVVALSTDLGRGWNLTPLPGTDDARYVSVGFSGSDVYARVHDRGTASIFRHTPAGWTPVWRANGTEPWGMHPPTLCPGGLLLSALDQVKPTDSRLLFSSDQGRTWQVADQIFPINASAVPAQGGSVWLGWYETPERSRPVFSRDCRHWEMLAVR